MSTDKAIGWYATHGGNKAAFDSEGRTWPVTDEQAEQIDARRAKV